MRLAHRSSAADAARHAPGHSSQNHIVLPATSWSRPGARGWPMGGVLRHLGAWFTGPQLDVRLAEGEDPSSDPALACRSAQLVCKRSRQQLASGLERLCSRTRPRAAFSAAIPIDGTAVGIARPVLEQLAITLRSGAPIQPRGVALTRLFLTEPCSALYKPSYCDELREVACEALSALASDHARRRIEEAGR